MDEVVGSCSLGTRHGSWAGGQQGHGGQGRATVTCAGPGQPVAWDGRSARLAPFPQALLGPF